MSDLQTGIGPGEFNRTFRPLTETEFPKYHETLRSFGLWKDSFAVSRCGIDSIRLTCKENEFTHNYQVPIPCQRRTCPECTFVDMLSRVRQISPIEDQIEMANDFSGEYFPNDWRVRFVTLTTKAIPGIELKEPIEKTLKAFGLWWRKVYGDLYPYPDKNADPETGGLFSLEIQSGWNVHLHGIVLSGFRHVAFMRDEWEKSLRHYGWFGNWIHVDMVHKKHGETNYRGALYELVQYPVKPNKKGRHDEILLAYVEAGLKKHRRFVTKGAWYNKFPKEKTACPCPVCGGDLTVIRDKKWEEDFGRCYTESLFPYTDEGKQNFQRLGREALIKKFMGGVS